MNLRIKPFLSGVMLILLLSCQQNEYSQDSAFGAIENAMAEQERSWSNGDIEAFMKYYEKSDDLSFTSKNGLTKGYQTLLNRYRESYPGKQDMGELQFDLMEHKSLGRDHMLVIGSWKLLNNQNNPSGYFSLIWKNTGSGWRIIHDHTS